MKNIKSFTMLLLLMLIGFFNSSFAQEISEEQQTFIDNDWYLTKLVIEDEVFPFVPDASLSNVQLLVMTTAIDDGEVEGQLSTEFCDQGACIFSLPTDVDLFAYGWSILAMNRPAGTGNGYQNCGYASSDYTGNRVDNNQYFYDFWQDYPDDHYLYEIIETDNIKELILTGDNGRQAYFQSTPLSVEQNLFSEVKLYPNPMNDLLFVDQLPEKSKMEIYDVNGKLLISQNLTSENAQLDVSSLSEGIYFYRLSNTIEQFKTGKLVKN